MVGPMLRPEPATWGAWIWFLHIFAVAYLFGFVVAWFRFRRLVRRLKEPGGREIFNAGIRGFPWSFYAKMLGKTPLTEPQAGPEKDSN